MLFGNRGSCRLPGLSHDRFADLLFVWNKWSGRW